MKATITRTDGTKVELEGLTDDVVRAVQALSPTAFTHIPEQQPYVSPVAVRIDRDQTWWPRRPDLTWTTGTE